MIDSEIKYSEHHDDDDVELTVTADDQKEESVTKIIQRELKNNAFNSFVKYLVGFVIVVSGLVFGVILLRPLQDPPHSGTLVRSTENIWVVTQPNSIVYHKTTLMKHIAGIYYRQNQTEIQQSGYFYKINSKIDIVIDSQYHIPICAAVGAPDDSGSGSKFPIFDRKTNHIYYNCFTKFQTRGEKMAFIMLLITTIIIAILCMGCVGESYQNYKKLS